MNKSEIKHRINKIEAEILWLTNQQTSKKLSQKQFADYNRQIKESEVKVNFLYADL